MGNFDQTAQQAAIKSLENVATGNSGSASSRFSFPKTTTAPAPATPSPTPSPTVPNSVDANRAKGEYAGGQGAVVRPADQETAGVKRSTTVSGPGVNPTAVSQAPVNPAAQSDGVATGSAAGTGGAGIPKPNLNTPPAAPGDSQNVQSDQQIRDFVGSTEQDQNITSSPGSQEDLDIATGKQGEAVAKAQPNFWDNVINVAGMLGKGVAEVLGNTGLIYMGQPSISQTKAGYRQAQLIQQRDLANARLQQQRTIYWQNKYSNMLNDLNLKMQQITQHYEGAQNQKNRENALNIAIQGYRTQLQAAQMQEAHEQFLNKAQSSQPGGLFYGNR